MIPKIIHYCWFSKDKSKELPEMVKRSIASWKENLPDYEIKLWNEDNFDVNSVPWVKECYECGCGSYGYIVDYLRLYILYNYGGIYVDADQMVIKSLDSFLDNKMFVGMINPGEIGWGIVGAEKGNPTIKTLLNKYHNKHYLKEDGSLNICNSIYSTTAELKELFDFKPDIALLQKFNGLTIYPKDYFYPINEYNTTENTHSIHLGLTSHYKMISVIMPVYNGEKYLKECIDSVLTQSFTDFEFIIVDDGSTDNTESIIKSYKDDRIVYIKTEHKGISEALNLGIRRSIGLYLVRIDSDDMMYPNRLSYQYNYMSSHPNIDILGCGFEWGNGKEKKEYFKPLDRDVTRDILDLGNCIAHPTVIMRKSSLMKLPFIYEKLYDGAEDLKLWYTAITHGLKVHTTPQIVTYYRQHENQCTVTNSNNGSLSARRVYRAYQHGNYRDTNQAHIFKLESKLTAILTFQNEGYEVEKTVTSIRATSNAKIILINDHSTDNYDYERIAKIFACDYYETKRNLGVAGSRNLGVFKCTTPYFVLLDAHMRFYDDNWDNKLINLLNENPKRLITSNSIVFTKNRYGIYDNEDGSKGRTNFGTYGAFVNLDEAGWEFSAKWTDKLIDSNNEVTPISCVLGAVYASSTDWWYKIGGLTGLIKYGFDEPLMSIKTWLAGGEVLIIKNWGVGHLYRNSGNYRISCYDVNANQIYLINLFSNKDDISRYEENLKKRVGESSFNKSKSIFISNYKKFKDFKEYFFKEVAIHDMSYFNEINNKVKC